MEGTIGENFLFEAGKVDEIVSRIEHLIYLNREELINEAYKMRNTTANKFNASRTVKDLAKLFE
ncbi:MAG: hypothetical protein F7C07_06245 [Desulfurococcales archaeon]|nr:hypothetical protein [Desulfurococcales archaeon]